MIGPHWFQLVCFWVGFVIVTSVVYLPVFGLIYKATLGAFFYIFGDRYSDGDVL